MIRRARLVQARTSSVSVKLPLSFALGTWLAFFFISKAGLPSLSSPLSLIACWLIEKKPLFSALIWISLLSALLDPLWGTGSKVQMISHVLATFAAFGLQPGIFNFPTQMKWGLRIVLWSFVLMSSQAILYPEYFRPQITSYFASSDALRFFEFFFHSLYDGFILGTVGWLTCEWLHED